VNIVELRSALGLVLFSLLKKDKEFRLRLLIPWAESAVVVASFLLSPMLVNWVVAEVILNVRISLKANDSVCGIIILI